MAVQSDTSSISYTGNNSTVTSYAVPFVFLENAHLKAIARTAAGVETVVTLTNHTGAGNVNGGTVRTAVAVPATSTLVIYREVPATQTTIYQEGGDFPAASHERALDKLTQIAQQNARGVASSVKTPEGETTNTVLPAAVNRANRAMGFAANGGVSVSGSTLTQIDGAVSAINTIASAPAGNSAGIAHIASGSGATATTVQAKLRESVSVKDFGAIGDGVADDTAAIHSAIDSLPAAGGSVYVPRGTYLISSAVVINKHNVTLFGAGRSSILKKSTTNAILIHVGSAAATTEGNRIEKFSCTNMAFDGGDFSDSSDDYPVLYCQYVNEAMVSDCSFFNCNHALRLGRGDNAWSLTNRRATRSQAVNNYFFNCRTFAIEFFSTESCIASHNVIVGGSSSASAPCVGIRVVESSRTAILNNTISDNGRGIAFSSVNAQVGVVVRGNTVQGTTSGSSMSVGGPTENTVIEDNIFSGAGDTAAISAIGSSGGTILQTNLTFRNNALTSTTTSTHTVRFDYPTGLLFEGNRIRNANTTSNALLIQNGDGYCSVAGNYFDIASATAYAVRDIAGAASMTLDTKNNTFKLGDMSRKVIRSGGSQSIYKNADIASLRDFGAVGNGSTDDSAAVLLALNSGSKLIDGGGLTYRLNSNITVTADNFILQNAHFSLISNSSGGPAIRFSGTQASAVALTSSTSKGANTVVVSSTAGFNADDYAWIMSDVIFATGTINTKVGQIVKIKAVNGATSMTLHEDVLYSFNTADNATIAKITPKSNITFRHVSFTGANANLQEAVEFDKCVNVCCENCSFSYVDRGAIDLVRCANVVVSDTSVRYARLAGFSYGVIMQQGCYGVRIANCYGEDTRHLVTTGGSEGVNVFITVTGCHSAASRDAGFDGHAQTDFMVIDGNTVECVDDANDGIIFQGLNCVISNNIIVGNAAIGIRHQLLADIQNASCVISGNSIQNHGGTPSTDVAIYVANETKGAALGRFEKVIVANNGVHGSIDTGVYIYAKDGDINNVTVSGNIVSSEASVAACFLRADASRTMDSFSITGNTFRAGSGTNNIYILGDTSPNIVKGAISGNTLRGGNNGIRLIQSQDVVETGNYITATTRKVFVDTGASNVWLDRRFYSPVTTTSSTYTVTTENGHIICNRAETVTLTLPTASQWTGRELTVKTIQAQTVVSASSDVVPIDGSAAGTAILPATGGAWALLRSDGTNWVIMQRG